MLYSPTISLNLVSPLCPFIDDSQAKPLTSKLIVPNEGTASPYLGLGALQAAHQSPTSFAFLLGLLLLLVVIAAARRHGTQLTKYLRSLIPNRYLHYAPLKESREGLN